MAEKLSIRIALEGGEEIARQLEGIGEAGQKAFIDISKSAEQAGGFKQLKPEEVTTKLQEMGVTGADAIKKIQNAVKSAGRLETLVQGISSVETGLKALSIAAIPVGAAIVAGMVAAAKATISFAESINKVSDQAIKLGMSVEKFDQLRGSLEAAGISGKGVSTILESLGKAADTAALSKVTQAVKELQEASTRGFGAQGTAQLKTLMEAAKEVGPAADAARKALVDLGLVKVDPQGVAVIEGLPQTLAQLVGSTGSAEAGIAAFVEQLRQMPAGAQQSKLAVQELGAGAAELVRALNAGQISADQFTQKITGLITEEQAGKAAELGAAINRLQSAWDRFGSVTFALPIVAELNALTTALQALQSVVSNFSWGGFAGAVTTVGQALEYFTIQGWAALAVAKAVAAIKGVVTGGAPASSNPSQPGGIPMAGGGLLGGRGTGTSDSNLAWLSRGEHIMPARAVSQPGVLAFLEALRRSGGNLRSVLDGMGRFALGGVVPRAAFATGGLAGGSHVTIQFPGLPAIGGLRASSDVVDQLQRAAALAQVRSGGRKPSRYS